MTSIEWTRGDDGSKGKTWNPTTGCDRVSPGCDLCYALTMAKRLKAMGSAKYQRDGDPRTSGPGFGLTEHPHALDLPLRWRKPTRIFVNSMSDLFHGRVTREFLARTFAVMALTPQHTYQILTKRPLRMCRVLSDAGFYRLYEDAISALVADDTTPLMRAQRWRIQASEVPRPWPLPSVWLGTSVENQEEADRRIPYLFSTPAAVRFLSCEPLLGPVNLWPRIDPSDPDTDCEVCGEECFADERGIGHDRLIYDEAGENLLAEEWCPGPGVTAPRRHLDWVIIGGESGRGARPMEPAWAERIVTQCQAAGVPVFVKQMGATWAKEAGVRPPAHEPSEWPAGLRVREFPNTTVVGQGR